PNSTHLVNEDLEQIFPADLEKIDLKWQMAMLTMRARRFLKNTRRKLNLNGNDSVAFDKTKVESYNYHKRGYFTRECREPRGDDNRSRDVTRTVLVETPNSSALISCDGLGGYDWSDEAEEGPTNYVLMAYPTSSALSLDSEASDCSKSCLKAVENLKSTNEKFITDLRKSKIMVVAYKEGLKSIEQRLKFFKTNESKYIEQINVLKIDIHCRDITLIELQRKLDLAETEKEGIQLNVSLFPPPKSDLSYTRLEELFNEPKTKKSKGMSNDVEPKSVRKGSDTPIIDLNLLGKVVILQSLRIGYQMMKGKRPINDVHPKRTLNAINQESYFSKQAHPFIERPNQKLTALKNSYANKKVKTVWVKKVNTAKPKAAVNAAKAKAKHNSVNGIKGNAIKVSACW
nr:hypothetical protein [Tanacetum cinerariifolium]